MENNKDGSVFNKILTKGDPTPPKHENKMLGEADPSYLLRIQRGYPAQLTLCKNKPGPDHAAGAVNRIIDRIQKGGTIRSVKVKDPHYGK